MLNVEDNWITRIVIEILCCAIIDNNTSITVLDLGYYWIYLILYDLS